MTNLHLTAFSEQVKDNAAMFELRNATLVLGKILPEHIKKKKQQNKFKLSRNTTFSLGILILAYSPVYH